MGKGGGAVGRGTRSHNNDVVLFSHSHTLSLCIITALPVMGATNVTALLKAGLRATTASCSPNQKQQQRRAASTTTLRPPRPRLDGPIMGPMVMAARLITTVDAGTAGVPYAS